MNGPILVLNCGSSSIKFALFDADADGPPRRARWTGKLDGIGGEKRPYAAALQEVRATVERQTGGVPPAAIAHRVVHGGIKYAAPVRLDAGVLADLKGYIPLAPLHQPYALQAIEVLLAELPNMPQVACFDTAFHRTLPQVEKMLPLTYEHWERGVRRYGFHGLSYEYMAIALAERHGDAARGRTIVAHIGSGASLCAMQGLQSVATTMGFSALDGLMMGTRCGSLDAGVLLYLLQSEKMGPGDLAQLLYRQSGLLGVSGVSSSPQVLLEAESRNPRARGARALRAAYRARDRRPHCRARRTRHAGLHRRRGRAQRGAARPHLRSARLARHRAGRPGERHPCADDLARREPRADCGGAHRRRMDRRVPRLACAAPSLILAMPLNSEARYPNRRTYVVKIRSDATPGTLAGRFENLVSGAQGEFSCARELLESIAADLEQSGGEAHG